MIGQCELDGKTYAQDEYFSMGDCGWCGCVNSEISCDINNCQQFSNVRERRETLENRDLDVIKNKIVEVVAGDENESDTQLNIVLSKLIAERLVRKTPRLNHKQIFLRNYAGIINYTPVIINVTSTPSEFNVTKTRDLIITKTYGISFKPTEVLGFDIETEMDSTGMDPTVRRQFKRHSIRTATHQFQVFPRQELRITNAVFQYDNVHEYLLDFEIDDESTIIVSDRTHNFKEFLSNNFDLLPLGNKHHLRLEYLHNKFVLRNFPAYYVISDFDIEISIALSEKDEEYDEADEESDNEDQDESEEEDESKGSKSSESDENEEDVDDEDLDQTDDEVKK